MADLTTLFNGLEGTGFYAIVLPFLLVFALVYGILQKLEQLPKEANAIIALALAFYAAFAGLLPTFLTAATAPLALLLLIVLFLMMGAQLTGFADENDWWTTLIGVVAVGGIALLVWIEGGIGAVYGTQPDAIIPGLPIDLPTLLILGAAAVLIWWMVFASEGGD